MLAAGAKAKVINAQNPSIFNKNEHKGARNRTETLILALTDTWMLVLHIYEIQTLAGHKADLKPWCEI